MTKEIEEKYSEIINKFPLKFKYKGIDKDWWYVVDYLEDWTSQKEKEKYLYVIVKSWNKYKMRYNYKVLPYEYFMWEYDFMIREEKY